MKHQQWRDRLKLAKMAVHDLEEELTRGVVMTWDDVRALHKMGMDVQSHTRSHRPLQTVAQADLESELKGAKEDLERELGTLHVIRMVAGRELRERLRAKSFYILTGLVVVLVFAIGLAGRFVSDDGPSTIEVAIVDANDTAMEPAVVATATSSVVLLRYPAPDSPRPAFTNEATTSDRSPGRAPAVLSAAFGGSGASMGPLTPGQLGSTG